MVDQISQSHLKLLSTPTAGVPGENSPYYRRLISAGYKGYLQGSVGGATLYGVLGAAVGVLAGAGVLLLTGGAAGIAAFAAVPFMAGYGALKGAGTFGNIGSSAAQLAEFAETNERRRGLLDRLGETQSKEEAIEIQKILSKEGEETKPKGLFKWKTLVAGALIGAAFGVGLAFLAPALHLTAITGFLAAIPGGAAMGGAMLAGVGAVLGGATGSMIGLDRYYVRRWMDGTELFMNDQSKYEEISTVRENEVFKLSNIARAEEWANGYGKAPTQYINAPKPSPIQDKADLPSTSVSNADYQDRVANAMQYAPVV